MGEWDLTITVIFMALGLWGGYGFFKRLRHSRQYCKVCKYNTPDCICKGDES